MDVYMYVYMQIFCANGNTGIESLLANNKNFSIEKNIMTDFFFKRSFISHGEKLTKYIYPGEYRS